MGARRHPPGRRQGFSARGGSGLFALADRLRGGDPIAQPWPRHERVLTRAERYELQQLLARRGYNVGEPDGLLGSRTRAALREFQASIGVTPDGFASATIL